MNTDAIIVIDFAYNNGRHARLQSVVKQYSWSLSILTDYTLLEWMHNVTEIILGGV